MKSAGSTKDVSLDRAILHLLHRAGQVTDEAFSDAALDMDVTPRQIVVLSAIAANPKSSQTSIVNSTGIDRSTLAELVKRLEKKKLITRKRSRTDARAYLVDLTDSGRGVLQVAAPLANEVDKTVTKILGRKRRDELSKSLRDLIDGLAARQS